MGFRDAVIIALLSIAAVLVVAQSQSTMDFGGLFGGSDGHGLVADALGMDAEMMFDTESTRRQLGRGRGGYISYGAMERNRVPCNQRGQSYYNCRDHQRANPYNRGCTRATRCARQSR